MNLPPLLRSLCIVSLIAAAPVARAQSLDDLFNRGVALLQNRGYQEAEDVFTQIIRDHEASAERIIGPAFGTVYFHRGLARLQQGKHSDAADDFETTATKYANRQGESRVNPYATISLMQAGGCYMKGETPDYERAFGYFRRFEAAMNGDPVDKDSVQYNRAAFMANVAICEAKTGKPDQAEATFKRLMEDPGGFDRASRSSFDLTPQTIPGVAVEIIAAYHEAKQHARAIGFINTYRKPLTVNPAISYFHALRYLQMASEAARDGVFDFALAAYSILPTSQQVLDALVFARARPEAFPPAPEQKTAYTRLLERIEARVRADIASGTPLDAWVLDGIARVFQLNGNNQAAYGIYRTLIEKFPQGSMRPQMLYYGAVAASVTGRLDETQRFGQLFLTEFPNHELKPRVEELLLEGLFWNGRYEDALRIATELRPRVGEGNPQRELCDFVIGGSQYFLGMFAEAETELRDFLRLYPESTNLEPARFYLADNLTRLNKFVEAGGLLDGFLKEYPDSQLLDLALFSRANVHFNLEQLGEAGTRLGQFFSKRPNSQIRDQAMNLMGNVNESRERFEDAENNYKAAYEIATQFGNDATAAQSLLYLMSLLSAEEERDNDLLEAYDTYFRKFQDDPNRARAAVVPLDAMKRKGNDRLRDGLDRIEKLIAEFRDDADAPGMEDLILSYIKYTNEMGVPFVQLREKLYNFPRVPAEAQGVRARLQMALIDFLESELKGEKDNSVRARMEGEIQGAFQRLRNEFPPERLSNYSLVRLGAFLSKLGEFQSARPYFQRAIDSPEVAYKDDAIFQMGQLLFLSENAEDNAKAPGFFQRILADFVTNRRLVEDAMRMTALSYERAGKWEDMGKAWRAYLDHEGGSLRKYQTEAFYKLGLSYDKRGMWDAALDNYIQVWVLDPGNLLFSSPAWFRMAEINFKERGRKQNGYDNLWDMIRKQPGGIGHLADEEQKIIANPDAYVDAYNKILMAGRLRTNFIRRGEEELMVWEREPGVTARAMPQPR